MAKRKPAKPVPMTRAGRALRAARRPAPAPPAEFVMPGPAERDARQDALHSALAKFVARRQNQSTAGKPVTEQDQTLTVEVDYPAHGAADLVHPGSATGSESEAGLTTGEGPTLISAPTIEAAKINEGGVEVASTPRRRTTKTRKNIPILFQPRDLPYVLAVAART